MHSILHPNSNSQMSTESFVIRRVSLIVQQLELAFSVYSSLSSHDDNDNVDNVRKLCFKSLPGGGWAIRINSVPYENWLPFRPKFNLSKHKMH